MCGNHVHAFDAPAIVVTAKRKIRFVAKEELYDSKFMAWLANTFDTIKSSVSNENGKEIYVVSSKIVYKNSPQLVKIRLTQKGKDLKIIGFSFTNQI